MPPSSTDVKQNSEITSSKMMEIMANRPYIPIADAGAKSVHNDTNALALNFCHNRFIRGSTLLLAYYIIYKDHRSTYI
jgi:hypothetical protein